MTGMTSEVWHLLSDPRSIGRPACIKTAGSHKPLMGSRGDTHALEVLQVPQRLSLSWQPAEASRIRRTAATYRSCQPAVFGHKLKAVQVARYILKGSCCALQVVHSLLGVLHVFSRAISQVHEVVGVLPAQPAPGSSKRDYGLSWPAAASARELSHRCICDGKQVSPQGMSGQICGAVCGSPWSAQLQSLPAHMCAGPRLRSTISSGWPASLCGSAVRPVSGIKFGTTTTKWTGPVLTCLQLYNVPAYCTSLQTEGCQLTARSPS